MVRSSLTFSKLYCRFLNCNQLSVPFFLQFRQVNTTFQMNDIWGSPHKGYDDILLMAPSNCDFFFQKKSRIKFTFLRLAKNKASGLNTSS